MTLCRIPTAARRECISPAGVCAGTSVAHYSAAGARDLFFNGNDILYYVFYSTNRNIDITCNNNLGRVPI